MKENKKNTEIKLRITSSEKELWKEYCEEYDLTLSELIRDCVSGKIAKWQAVKKKGDK